MGLDNREDMVKKVLRTYLKFGNISNDCHPREGGGPFQSLKNMDSRLRGNDALQYANKIYCEIGSKHICPVNKGNIWVR
jgi:hypothetical protein